MCSMTTRTFDPEATKSMAPPIPLIIFPGITQFAMSPVFVIYIAPKTVISKCPPLIIPKDSLLSNVVAPGLSVHDSFPAFERSPNSCPNLG